MSATPRPRTDRREGESPAPSPEPGGLAHRLRALARLLPEGAVIQLDARALDALAAPESDDHDGAEVGPDLTVAEAAVRLRLSKNRIRALIAAREIAAYRIAGRGGWRITPAALAAFRRVGAPEPPTVPETPGERADLSRWRRIQKGGGQP